MTIIWKQASGGTIPQGGVVSGKEANGTPLYVARAGYSGGVHPGKVRPAFGGANIPYGGGEHKVNPYDVYCGGGHWKAASGGNIPIDAVTCGHEADGTPLYAARASYQGGIHPGKVRPAFGAANIPYGGQEVKVSSYEVLCA